MAAFCNPELVKKVAEGGYSNTFIYNFVYSAELSFEKGGVWYLHSVVIAAILLMVANSTAAEKLNEKYTEWFRAEYRPSHGSYADLLLEILFRISENSPFLTSVVCVFQFIAPYISSFSMSTALKVLTVFQNVHAKDPDGLLVSLFLQAFASIVQREENKTNWFLVALFGKFSFFKDLEVNDTEGKEALDILLRWLKTSKKAARATNQGQMAATALAEVLAGIDIEGLFPEVVDFTLHPHVFGGEIEKTWAEWADLLYVRASGPEVQTMKALQAEMQGQGAAKKE
jgi:hypothetical protein